MKGYVHRWLSSAAQVAPFLADKLLPTLRTSAEAAAAQCMVSGDATVSQQCGFYWSNGTFVDPEDDGTSGAGEGLSVFSAVTSLLVADAAAPATAATSGDSSGTSQGGSPTGTVDGSSPSGTGAANSGVGRFRVEVTTSLLLGVMAVFAWVL